MSITGKFKKSLEDRWSMQFKCNGPDKDHYNGVVMKIGKTFVVLNRIFNLALDGILILPRKAVTGYRDGKNEVGHNQVLRFHHLIEKLKIPGWLSKCESIPEILKALQKRDIWPIVEVNYEGNQFFHIGPIVEVNEREFHIRNYKATGKWDQFYILEYSWLLRIGFGDCYSTRFNKFMRAQIEE